MAEPSVEQVLRRQQVCHETLHWIKVADTRCYFANGVLVHNCDDAHKADEVYSDAKRKHVLNWWDGTMSSRGNDPATVRRLIVMQRLHEQDLSGHLLEHDRGYDHLVLPLRWEDDHPYKVRSSLGFKDPREDANVSPLLWPGRFDEDACRRLEREMEGPYNIAGQLQQRPAPGSGGTFQQSQFRYFVEEGVEVDGGERAVFKLIDADGRERRFPSDECTWFQACDTALKTGEENAYTVVMTFAMTQNPRMLLVYDVFRERVPVPGQYNVLVQQRLKYPQLAFQAVEEKASGYGIIQEGRMRGTPFYPLRPPVDKIARCGAICIAYQNGIVFHRTPAQAPWLEPFEHELLVFPMSERNDQVDALAYGGIIMQGTGVMQAISAGSLVYSRTRSGSRNGEEEADQEESTQAGASTYRQQLEAARRFRPEA